MNAELAAISPLAAFLGSFFDGQAQTWALILMSTMAYWFFLFVPAVVVIGYLDRKLGADIQMRIGPNRVSAYGLLQPLADTVKLLFKEDGGPEAQEGWLFRWGTVAAIVCVFAAVGGVPMAQQWALSNLNSSLVWVLAALLLANMCLFWSAYSARSQWSVVSAFRVFAMVSAYAVPVAISLVPPVLVSGSSGFDQIVRSQGGAPWRWLAFHDPGTLFSCAALFLGLQIWQGRVPFDYARAEGEIAGGFAAEYGGLRKGLLSFLEYASFFLSCALVVTAYLGGWQTPFYLDSFGRATNLVEWLIFMAKVLCLAVLSTWIRWSLPRLRIDQIVALAWRVLVPVGLAGTALTAVWLVLFNGKGLGDFL